MYVLQITAMHDNELTFVYRPTRYGHALYGEFTAPPRSLRVFTSAKSRTGKVRALGEGGGVFCLFTGGAGPLPAPRLSPEAVLPLTGPVSAPTPPPPPPPPPSAPTPADSSPPPRCCCALPPSDGCCAVVGRPPEPPSAAAVDGFDNRLPVASPAAAAIAGVDADALSGGGAAPGEGPGTVPPGESPRGAP